MKKLIHIFLIVIVFFLLIAPLLTLIHELGHAVIPLLKNDKVSIHIGSEVLFKSEFGDLTLSYGNPYQPWIGYTHWNNYNGIWAIILGPMFSLFIAIILFYISLKIKSKFILSFLIYMAIGWSGLQFLFTSLPLSYPKEMGYPAETYSDGMRIYEYFNKR